MARPKIDIRDDFCHLPVNLDYFCLLNIRKMWKKVDFLDVKVASNQKLKAQRYPVFLYV